MIGHRGPCSKQVYINNYPTPHISIAVVYRRSPKNNSGGRYHLVTTQLVYSFPSSSSPLASPKSAICNMPSLLINRLAAFISRCKILFCREIVSVHVQSFTKTNRYVNLHDVNMRSLPITASSTS
jgi:hypothetical protein